jgi:hypothetical protein
MRFALAFVPQFHVYPEYNLGEPAAKPGDNDTRAPRFISGAEFAINSRLIAPETAPAAEVPKDLQGVAGCDGDVLLKILARSSGLLPATQPVRTTVDKTLKLDVDVQNVEGGSPDPVIYCRMFRDRRMGSAKVYWRVQYCVLLSDSTADRAAAYRLTDGKQLNHRGDWLYVEVLVSPEAGEKWVLHEVVMGNHSRRILLRPRDLPAEHEARPAASPNAVRAKLWLEQGSHEPYPFGGTEGMRGAPKGVWYTSDGKDRVRDHFLAHAGNILVSPEKALVRLLDPARAQSALDRSVLQLNGEVSRERLDEEFVARFRGAYGDGPRDADNPAGPFFGGPGWPSIMPADGKPWRDGTKFQGNPAFAAFLDRMSEWAELYQEYLDWVGENPWAVITWPVVAPFMITHFGIAAVFGGLESLFELSFGDGTGGEGGDEGNFDAPVELLPTRTRQGEGKEGLFIKGAKIYWYTGGREHEVCDVPRLTRGGQEVGRLLWAEPAQRNVEGLPTSIVFDAPVRPTANSQRKLDEPYRPEGGEAYLWWSFPDESNRAYRPDPGDGPGPSDAPLPVIPPLGAAKPPGYQVRALSGTFEVRYYEGPQKPGEWRPIVKIPTTGAVPWAKEPIPIGTPASAKVVLRDGRPDGVGFQSSGSDVADVVWYASSQTADATLLGLPRILPPADGAGAEPRVRIANGKIYVGNITTPPDTWKEVAEVARVRVNDAEREVTFIRGHALSGPDGAIVLWLRDSENESWGKQRPPARLIEGDQDLQNLLMRERADKH